MKQAKTVIREAQGLSDEYEYYADQERTGEISRATYHRVCKQSGASKDKADQWLRENYRRAGMEHLF